MAELDFDAYRRIREMAAVGVADLWVECEIVFGAEPPALAIFDFIFDKLIMTAKAKGAGWQAIVDKLEMVKFSGGDPLDGLLDDE